MRGRLLLARFFIVVIAIFLLVWSLWYELGQDLWDYMAVTGAIYSIGAFTLLLGGLYWKRASRIGAYLALGAGTLALLGLRPVQALLGIEGGWSGETVGLSALGLALALMVVGSLLFPERKNGN